MGHLSPEELIDIAEGTRDASSARHLDTCGVCRQQLADTREMMGLALVADVPEPSPLFWDHLSARVRQSVSDERTGRTARWNVEWFSWRGATAAACAVAALAVTITLRSPDRGGVVEEPRGVEAVAVAPDAAGPAADDPSLALLSDLAGDLDWEDAVEAGMSMPVGTVDEAVTDLSAVERVELRRLLQEVMVVSGV